MTSYRSILNIIPTSHQKDIVNIDSGFSHSCAISQPILTAETGTLGCWGDNKFGQSDIPSSFDKVSMIALGAHHTCAISPRMLACWGLNVKGQTTVPIAFRKAYSVDSCSFHTCALAHMKNKNMVGCWGKNEVGEINVPQNVYG